ncbi:MAG: response regulator [Burkholderiaceae bacterium]
MLATLERSEHGSASGPSMAISNGVRRHTDRPRRVLLIEDTPDIRTLLRFLLQSSGIQVMAVGDGRSALELIECWPAPDVILLDRMLPFVDGDELLRRIRAEPSWAHVPIVVVSAKAREEEIAQAMAAGANEYITKPFSPMHVMKVLERYLPND